MHLDVIREPTENLLSHGGTPDARAHDDEWATAKTANVLDPRERIRGLVAARLFGGVATPLRVGRFELQRELGAGGMAVVYAAHDPRLDRVIALKILRGTHHCEDASQRLLREAQAMARLRHANVVQVYESGVHGGQVHIAMELIQGGTLREWMGQRPRPWSEVREVMLAAGRGLAAAHNAGLIHRDFKPGNVLIDADGQPRVSDFGLARGSDEENAGVHEAERTEELGRGGLLELVLTRTGAILGTPAYMSPEQFRGEPSTPRSDQFAFCIVVWEALCGQRPFVSETLGGLLLEIESGAITQAPGVRLARRLRKILERGLSPLPGDRYPSMVALLAELERVPQSRRHAWRRLAVASLMAISLAAGIAATFVRGQPSDVDKERFAAVPTLLARSCLAIQSHLTDAWSPAFRDRLRERLAAAEGIEIGDPRIARVLTAIDRRIELLQKMTAKRCEADLERTGFDNLRRDGCESDRRQEFINMLASLEQATDPKLREVEGLMSMVADESECELAMPSWSPMHSPEEQLALWDARRSIAWAFAPGAVAASVAQVSLGLMHAEEVAARHKDVRFMAELDFTNMIIAARNGAAAVDASLLESFERATAGFHSRPFVPSGPMVDLRARLAVLRFEVHAKSGDSTEESTTEFAAAASAALDKLPAEHRLRLRREHFFDEGF